MIVVGQQKAVLVNNKRGPLALACLVELSWRAARWTASRAERCMQ